MPYIYKLTPAAMANVWGGNKLFRYGKKSNADRIGESWELSFVCGSESKLEDGRTTAEAFSKADWGKRAEKFPFFPTLTKFIDAREKLSVQVHPSDEYALKNEGQYGKSEMWYVVDADEGAGLYLGLNASCEPETLAEAITDGSVENLLSFKPVKKGDVFFIPAGTIHAIGGGVLIFEIQQNSTLTYRLYDYMRRDKDGNLRELHVEKALKVLNAGVYTPKKFDTPSADNGKIIGKCEYFTTKEYSLNNTSAKISVDENSFKAVTVVSGEGTLSFTDESGNKASVHLSLGDTYFAPANANGFDFTLNGTLTAITVEV